MVDLAAFIVVTAYGLHAVGFAIGQFQEDLSVAAIRKDLGDSHGSVMLLLYVLFIIIASIFWPFFTGIRDDL